jgi:hypothetical protein
MHLYVNCYSAPTFSTGDLACIETRLPVEKVWVSQTRKEKTRTGSIRQLAP